MKINKIINAKITDEGKIRPYDVDEWNLHLGSLAGKDVEILIEKKIKKRTPKQNDYLWGGIYKTISLSTGYSVNELHNIFGSMFLKYQYEFNGKIVEMIKSTADLTTEEMAEYIMNIGIEVAEIGIILPSSEEWNLL